MAIKYKVHKNYNHVYLNININIIWWLTRKSIYQMRKQIGWARNWAGQQFCIPMQIDNRKWQMRRRNPQNIIEIAIKSFSKMRTILTSTKLSITLRIRFIRCYVWSTLLYWVETWDISKISQLRLETFELWTLGWMLRIDWTRREKGVTIRMNEQIIDRHRAN